MTPSTDWASAIAILAGGLVLGALIVYFFSKGKSPRASASATAAELERKELEARRDALVAQLRALDDDNVVERARLEAETAEVLRRLDQVASGPPPPPEAAAAMNPAFKGFLWGIGSCAAIAGLIYYVMNQTTPRQEGGTVTGNTPMQQQATAPPQPNQVVLQLEAAVKQDPNNLRLRNDLAQAYLETDNLMAVFEQTKFVLDQSPNDSRALTYQSLVRMAMGESDTAVQMLQRATQSDPANLDGWVALAWVHVQQNQLGEAEKMIAEAKKHSPNDAARLDQVFVQMKAQVAGMPAQPAGGGGMPEGHPPVAGGVAAAADEKFVTVTLDIDPSAAQKSGVLFVIARNPMGGPPSAVKRVQVTSFPITLQLGSADSMMGQPFPDKFRLEARLDSDGDATTRPPTDPSAMQNDVVPGTTVKLALK